MHCRRLGKSNLKVSALCLGTMMFGRQTACEEAASIMASAKAHGINFIDTADVYNHGQSERDVGPRMLSQLEDVYGALDLVLDNEDEAFINALVVPGHVSTPGFNDPSYPFFGRPV